MQWFVYCHVLTHKKLNDRIDQQFRCTVDITEIENLIDLIEKYSNNALNPFLKKGYFLLLFIQFKST